MDGGLLFQVSRLSKVPRSIQYGARRRPLAASLFARPHRGRKSSLRSRGRNSWGCFVAPCGKSTVSSISFKVTVGPNYISISYKPGIDSCTIWWTNFYTLKFIEIYTWYLVVPSLFCCFREEHKYDTDAQRCQARNTRVRRSKGSQGNITVRWSLYHNDSKDISDLIWPSSGTLSVTDSQWSSSLTLNVASNIKKVPGNIIWIKLVETTGGAFLPLRMKRS